MLKRILFSNIPVIYFAGAVLGAFVGFLLLMATLNAWHLYQTFTQSKAGESKQYVTINKSVGLLNSVSSKLSEFSKEEIDSIRQAPFVDDMGAYVRSAFGVKASRQASSQMPYMRTQMFFEAVPDRFLDNVPDNWHLKPAQKHIPVIIPKEYLNLYNFGFAKAQGLPNVSASLIGKFQFDLTLYGNGRVEKLKGSVAGFTNRIQSLLVPKKFLVAANKRFAPNKKLRPDRLILKLKPNMEKQMYQYLSNHGYETTHDAFQGGKVALFVHTSSTVLLTIAGLIILLALIVYALTLQLTVQRNKDEIQQLILLGYKPIVIFRYYYWVQLIVASIVFIISAAGVLILTHEALNFLAAHYIELKNFSNKFTLAISGSIMVVFLFITGLNTYRLIHKLAKKGVL